MFDLAYNDDEWIDEPEYQAIKDFWVKEGEKAKERMNMLEDIMGSSPLSADPNISLSGQIKTVTEETASVLAGQINAIRIYQADMFILVKRQFDEQINLVDLSRRRLRCCGIV